MLNRVPLGSAGGVVGDGDVEGEAVGELSLQLDFPSTAAATVATARVRENQQLAGAGVLKKSFTLPPVSNVIELQIAIGTAGSGEFLLVDAERELHAVQQTCDRVRRYGEATRTQQVGNLACRAAAPFQIRHRIAGDIVSEKIFDGRDYFGRFFSVGTRPPPCRRVPLEATSRLSSC